MAIACEEYGAKFFANGAAPSGVLEHPGTIKDPARVRDTWQGQFGGSGNAGKVAVLEEGMKYTPISISPEQAQFLETRKFQINEIARIFRVPPHMVGDLEKSSFSNIEQQSLEFVKYTARPLGYQVGTGAITCPAQCQRKEHVLLQIQCGRPPQRRLSEPDDRLCDSSPERLDECK